MVNTDTDELVQMINRNNHEVSETIQDLNVLILDIRKNSKELADKIEDDKNSLADRTERCPDCGERLILLDKWDEPRGEMQGRDVFETIYKYGCECGYIKE